MDKLEFKNFQIAVKADAEKREGVLLTVEGYACVYGNIDSYDDIVMPGACDAFLKSDDAKRVRFCWQHDMREPIGVIRSMWADDKGVMFEADILDTARGRDAATLVSAGALSEFSIGYYATEYHFGEVEGKSIRYLDALYLGEISLVSRAANPEAVLTGMKEEAPQKGKEEAKPADLSTLSDEQLQQEIDERENEQARRLLEKIYG